MSAPVRIERVEDGRLCVVTPLNTPPDTGTDTDAGTGTSMGMGTGTGPSVLDAAPDVDVAVLEVAGGHLTWSVTALEALPVAVLDDPVRAQDWLWAVYGEDVAIALSAIAAGKGLQDLRAPAAPALPELLASARRLAFAHWAARWWPASVIDAVPPLDEGLLAAEIGELTDECDLLLGAEDREGEWEWEQEQEQERERAGAGEGSAPVGDRPHSAPRATDYALAAGPATTTAATAEADGMTLARGTGGSDWRRYPPGLIDASERAVSWEVVRASARTTLTVRAVAAPGPATVDPRLTPRATVGGASGPLEVGLRLVDDLWLGSAGLPDPHTGGLTVDLHLPGFGTPPRLPDEDRATHQEAAAHEDRAARRAVRTRVRNFVRHRLSGAPSATPLLRAEIAAAADDESDF